MKTLERLPWDNPNFTILYRQYFSLLEQHRSAMMEMERLYCVREYVTDPFPAGNPGGISLEAILNGSAGKEQNR